MDQIRGCENESASNLIVGGVLANRKNPDFLRLSTQSAGGSPSSILNLETDVAAQLLDLAHDSFLLVGGRTS